MGNTIGRGKKAKVMKIDGETFKLKTPVTASEVVKDYPGHVLLESESVKQFGIRATPLEPGQELKPRKIYFLIELPKFPEEKQQQQPSMTRRVRSVIQMSAKDRLECLMLSRRAVSDLSVVRQTPSTVPISDGGPDSGLIRVKMRLPKSQVDKLVQESEDNVQVAEKIIDLFMENSGGDGLRRQLNWKPELGSIGENFTKPREKRVSFLQDDEEIQLLTSH